MGRKKDVVNALVKPDPDGLFLYGDSKGHIEIEATCNCGCGGLGFRV
jgi:hypothetical protein